MTETTKCPVCGKEFRHERDWGYTMPYHGRSKYFCSYPCLRKMEHLVYDIDKKDRLMRNEETGEIKRCKDIAADANQRNAIYSRWVHDLPWKEKWRRYIPNEDIH